MSNKNPNVVLITEGGLNIDKFEENIKKEWNCNCELEKNEQEKFVSYFFLYNNIQFSVSIFNYRYQDDIVSDILNSRYSPQGKLIYDNHKQFYIVSVIGDYETDINEVYISFTRIMMSLLEACDNDKCFVYDSNSRQCIDKDLYLQICGNMKQCYEKKLNYFPINLYVNFIVCRNNDSYNAITLGFEVFNDYEIEICSDELDSNDIQNIFKFIVTNVISRQDKISNRDMIPVPYEGGYEQAIVKQGKSKLLNKETLLILV